MDSHDPPLRTVGVGCALVSLDAWLALPWLDGNGMPAPAQLVREEWAALGEMPGGHPAVVYRGPIHLADDAIDALALQRYDAIEAALLRRWPDAGDWPDEAWQALCSMGYALGTSDTVRPGLLSPEWPNLHAAVDARNWGRAARECVMQGPGLARRNAANVGLFEAAALTRA